MIGGGVVGEEEVFLCRISSFFLKVGIFVLMPVKVVESCWLYACVGQWRLNDLHLDVDNEQSAASILYPCW